MQMKQIISGGG